MIKTKPRRLLNDAEGFFVISPSSSAKHDGRKARRVRCAMYRCKNYRQTSRAFGYRSRGISASAEFRFILLGQCLCANPETTVFPRSSGMRTIPVYVVYGRARTSTKIYRIPVPPASVIPLHKSGLTTIPDEIIKTLTARKDTVNP